MKTIKVSEATPIQLDWLVAKCYYTDRRIELGVMGHAAFAVEIQPGSGDRYTGWMLFHPTTNWAQGGPIIERERLCARPLKEVWGCWVTDLYGDIHALSLSGFGPTPLIAAMCCYVASKMGDVVEVPEELT